MIISHSCLSTKEADEPFYSWCCICGANCMDSMYEYYTALKMHCNLHCNLHNKHVKKDFQWICANQSFTADTIVRNVEFIPWTCINQCYNCNFKPFYNYLLKECRNTSKLKKCIINVLKVR